MSVWDRMIGQPGAVATLQAAAKEGRDITQARGAGEADGAGHAYGADHKETCQALSHAWLITGPPGSGRSVAAKCLAAALQCTGAEIGCGECKGCVTTMAQTNADVQIYATDHAGYQVKGVREQWLPLAYTAPSGGKWRITIVEDADRLREDSANTLLKSIEEPPPRGIWVLCAPTPGEVLSTIRSRCRPLALRTPSVEDVAHYLVETEGVDLQKAMQAATLAQSHVGFARGLLKNPNLRTDLRAVFELPLMSQSVGEAVVNAGKMHKMLSDLAKTQTDRVDSEERKKLLTVLGVEEGRRMPTSTRSALKKLEEDQKRRGRRALADAIDRALIDLLGFYRDVATIQLQTQTPIVNVDMGERIQDVAANSTAEQTMARVDAIEKARKRNQTTAAPLLLLEAMAVSVFNPDQQN